MTYTYKCDRCGTVHPYTYTGEQVAHLKVRACIWGRCNGVAFPVVKNVQEAAQHDA